MNRDAKIVLGVAVGAALLYWLRNSLVADATQNTRGVTKQTSGGTVTDVKPVTSTPLKVSALAFVKTLLQRPQNATGGASKSSAPSTQTRTPSSAKLYPYSSPTLARAAFSSPVATPVSNYRASTYIPPDAPYSLN